MDAKTLLLLVSLCCSVAAVSLTATSGYSSTYRTSQWPSASTRRATTSSPRYTSYYMDNSLSQCSVYSYNYLRTSDQVAYVNAWLFSTRRSAVSSCQMTFSAFSNYDLSYRFVSTHSNYINNYAVTLNLYDGTSTTGRLLKSYSRFDSLSTSRSYVPSGDLTIELVNYGYNTNFDFEIEISSHSTSGGDDVGIIIGVTVGTFFLLMCFLIGCRMRRRQLYRRQQNAVLTASQGSNPPATYGSIVYPSSYPPPQPPANYPPPQPPANYPPYSQPPPPYSQAAVIVPPPQPMPQPPAGAVAAQPPPPGYGNPEYSAAQKAAAPAYGAV